MTSPTRDEVRAAVERLSSDLRDADAGNQYAWLVRTDDLRTLIAAAEEGAHRYDHRQVEAMSTEPKEAAPMPTLVERLLTATGRVGETAWCAEAANRIASLEAEVAALRKDKHDIYMAAERVYGIASSDYRGVAANAALIAYQREADKHRAALDSAIAAKGK